ncbi:MAG TPA: hypothetical protein VKV74_05125 [Bryobacteraceae bacterium]|nr:hypothetical protein [Bryobacteraceae bacterium]
MDRVNLHSIKLWWLLVAFLSGMAVAMVAEELILRAHGSRLEFAPQVPFLSAPTLLARLHNAEEVPFDMKATVFTGSRDHEFAHNEERFVVSYDIWEETFAATRMKDPQKQVKHMKANALEAWCISQMSLDLAGLGSSEPFWARLEIRAENPERDRGLFGQAVGDSGISLLSTLTDIFSRPAARQQPHWELNSPRLTLDELRRRKS